jgi:hypothetical protein
MTQPPVLREPSFQSFPDKGHGPQTPSASPIKPLAEEFFASRGGIVESESWKSLLSKTGRARNRAIGKLMRSALNSG